MAKATSKYDKRSNANSPDATPSQTVTHSHKPVAAKTKNVLGNVTPKFASRTIPILRRREVATKQNGKCAYPCCTKSIENFHHAVPFAFSRSHESIVGLCKIHHEFCHNGVVRHELKDPAQWELSLEPSLSQFDALKLKYTRSA